MKNIDKLIIYESYNQCRVKVTQSIENKVYTKLTVKLWEPSWLQVDNGMAQLLIMQIKNKLNYEEH
jgi:hypothetical protein